MFLFSPSPSCPPLTGTPVELRELGEDGEIRRNPAAPPNPAPPGRGSFAPENLPMESSDAAGWERGEPNPRGLCASPPCLSFPFHCYPDCSLLRTKTCPQTLQDGWGGSPLTGHLRPMLDPQPLSQNEHPVDAAAETAPKTPLLPNAFKPERRPGSGTGWALGSPKVLFPSNFTRNPPFSPRSASSAAEPAPVQADPLKKKKNKELAERCCPPGEGVGDKDKRPRSGTVGPASCRAGGCRVPASHGGGGKDARHPHAGSALRLLSAGAEVK